MQDPRIMCKNHWGGEHLEIGMFIGAMRSDISLDGYVEKNLFEPLSLFSRHEELVEEAKRRGYPSGIHHMTPLDEQDILQLVDKYPDHIKYAKIDTHKSLMDLISRCPECAKRFRALSIGDEI